MITGQGNGQGGREQGQKCDQLPGSRDITIQNIANTLLGSGVLPRNRFRRRVCRRFRSWKPFTMARSKDCFRSASIPLVSLPDGNFVREALEKLEFLRQYRLLSLRDRPLC